MQDSIKYQGLRNRLVQEISKKGIRDKKVLQAIANVPRHLFVEARGLSDNLLYADKALPIAAGQTISQPYTVAFQTSLLNIEPRDKILEIGTGSGYQSAVLLELKARVYTIERQRELYLKTQSLMPQIGYNPNFFYGDGYKGLPTYGPFSGIVVTAAAPYIPDELRLQLKIGGILVIPVGDDNKQVMHSVKRISQEEFEVRKHGDFRFVPMLKGVVK